MHAHLPVWQNVSEKNEWMFGFTWSGKQKNPTTHYNLWDDFLFFSSLFVNFVFPALTYRGNWMMEERLQWRSYHKAQIKGTKSSWTRPSCCLVCSTGMWWICWGIVSIAQRSSLCMSMFLMRALTSFYSVSISTPILNPSSVQHGHR